MPIRQGGKVAKKPSYLAATELSTKYDLACDIDAVDLKQVLSQIEPDHSNIVHNALPSSEFAAGHVTARGYR